MDELAVAVGLVGAGACLAERLTWPGRDWGPAAVVLAVMALMACGVSGAALVAGACAVAAAGLWTALAGPPQGRAPAVVDLVTMALLTAGAVRLKAAGAAGHPAGMRMSGSSGAYDVRFFLFVVGCWLLARAGVRLMAVVGSGAGRAPHPVGAAGRGAGGGGCRKVLRHAGSATMVVAMAAMLS